MLKLVKIWQILYDIPYNIFEVLKEKEGDLVKNRVIKIILGIGAVLLCLGGGYLLGSQNTAEVSQETVSIKKGEKKEKDKTYDTDLVAIINMDEGVEKDGETVSYSNSLMGTLNIKYEVTGIEAAKQGLENGKYSAYLILPGSFSAAVESINTSPQKATLEYAIAQNLTQPALTEAIYSIQDAYSTLSNGISELYLSSVLTEIHKVQDAVETIGANDEKDLNALANIQRDDLMEVIQLPELAKVENTIEVLDLAADYEETDSILTKIDETYQTAWTVGAESYEEVKTGSANLESKISGEAGTQSAVAALWNNHGSEMEIPEYVDPTEKENGEFSNIKRNTLKDLNDNVADVEGQLTGFKEDQDKYNAQAETIKSEYKKTINQMGDPRNTTEEGDMRHQQYQFYRIDEVDQKIKYLENEKVRYANEQLNTYYNKVHDNENLKSILEKYRDMYTKLMVYEPDSYSEKTEEEWADFTADALIEAPQLSAEPSPGTANPVLTPVEIDTYYPLDTSLVEAPDSSKLNLGGINVKNVEAAMDSMTGVSQKYTKERDEYRTKLNDQLKAKDVLIREDLGRLNSSYGSMLQAKDDLNGLIQNYDPQEYLDKQAVENLRLSLVTNQSDIEEKIGNQNRSYEEYVAKVYETSEENTKKQLESIETAETASAEKLDTNLANAKSLKQTTYENNQVMLNEIGGVLPYTRLGTQENVSTYRFMVNPLSTNDLTVASIMPSEDTETAAKGIGTIGTVSDDEEKGTPILIYAIPIIILLLICAIVLIRKARTGVKEDRL